MSPRVALLISKKNKTLIFAYIQKIDQTCHPKYYGVPDFNPTYCRGPDLKGSYRSTPALLHSIFQIYLEAQWLEIFWPPMVLARVHCLHTLLLCHWAGAVIRWWRDLLRDRSLLTMLYSTIYYPNDVTMKLSVAWKIPNPSTQLEPAQINSTNLSCPTVWTPSHSHCTLFKESRHLTIVNKQCYFN